MPATCLPSLCPSLPFPMPYLPLPFPALCHTATTCLPTFASLPCPCPLPALLPTTYYLFHLCLLLHVAFSLPSAPIHICLPSPSLPLLLILGTGLDWTLGFRLVWDGWVCQGSWLPPCCLRPATTLPPPLPATTFLPYHHHLALPSLPLPHCFLPSLPTTTTFLASLPAFMPAMPCSSTSYHLPSPPPPHHLPTCLPSAFFLPATTSCLPCKKRHLVVWQPSFPHLPSFYGKTRLGLRQEGQGPTTLPFIPACLPTTYHLTFLPCHPTFLPCLFYFTYHYAYTHLPPYTTTHSTHTFLPLPPPLLYLCLVLPT